MKRSTVASLATALSLVGLAACEETSNPPPPAPTFTLPSASPTTSGVDTSDASASAAATPDASGAAAGDASTDGAPTDAGGGGTIATSDVDSGAPAQFRACKTDSDCVAVARVGCCHNGWKEAVAATQKDAYAKSFTCPDPHPICPMYLINDQRLALCEARSHLCTMFKPEDIPCGGFIANPHQCPAGYHCAMSRVPDVGGTCVKN
jgi:hypothetical protein